MASTGLLLLLSLILSGCDGATSPYEERPPAPATTGSLQVEVNADGPIVPDSVSLRIGQTARSVGVGSTVSQPDVPVGAVTITLEGVPVWCAVEGENPRAVQVAPASVSTVRFTMTCEATRAIVPRALGPTSAATIGPAGGAVEAMAPDGSTFTLTVPSGALTAPTPIRVTPAGIAGLTGVVQSVLGGVILEPSGLQFAVPATLAIRPAGGLGASEHLMALVFDQRGTPQWQVPQLDTSGTAVQVEVRHFSGAAVAQLLPGAWGDLLLALGTIPDLQPVRGQVLSVSRGPAQLRACILFRVVTQQPGRNEPTPFFNAPVQLLSVEGRVRDFQPVEDRTDRDGYVCLPVTIREEDISPEGEWLVGTAMAFPGVTFQQTTRSPMALVDALFPVEVELLEPEGVASDQPFELCARVTSSRAVFARSVGYPVSFLPRSFGRQPVIPNTVTGANGRACTTAVVETRDDEPGADPFEVSAFVRELDLRITPIDAGYPGEPVYVETETRRTFPVTRSPLSLRLELAASVSVDETLPICATVERGGRPADGLDIVLRVVSGGGVFPDWVDQGGGRRALVQSGPDGPGRGCVDYTAPATDGADEAVVIEALVVRRAGGDLVRTATMRIEPRPVLTVVVTPTTLSAAGETSRVCGLLRDVRRDAPIEGVDVLFGIEGPGRLVPAAGTRVPTNADGQACIEYSAPNPFPAQGGTATIRASATPDLGRETLRASAVIQLQPSTQTITVTATPQDLAQPGATSAVCAVVRLAQGGAPVNGAVVRFSASGPGSLAGAGLPFTTVANGSACTTYTAPSPLPAQPSAVEVQASVDVPPGAPSVASATTIQLEAAAAGGEQWSVDWRTSINFTGVDGSPSFENIAVSMTFRREPDRSFTLLSANGSGSTRNTSLGNGTCVNTSEWQVRSGQLSIQGTSAFVTGIGRLTTQRSCTNGTNESGSDDNWDDFPLCTPVAQGPDLFFCRQSSGANFTEVTVRRTQ